MLLSLFLLGSYSFWILVALVSIFLFTCVEKLWTGWATIVLLSTVSVICIANSINPLVYAQENPLEIVKLVCAYTLIGIVWSVYRWYVFLLKRRDDIQKLKLEFLQINSIGGIKVPNDQKDAWLFYLNENAYQLNGTRGFRNTHGLNEARKHFLDQHQTAHTAIGNVIQIPEELLEAWNKEVQTVSRKVQFSLRPRPRDHKSLITLWMIYWPWSMMWYLLSDPIKRFANWIYRRIQQLLEAISEHVWKGVKDDLPPTDV